MSNVSKKLQEIIRDFFRAFDEKDTSKISQICLPETKIIHHNGVVTNTDEMSQIIKETKNWYPRKRNLSDFNSLIGEQLAIVGLKNYVVFSLPKGKKVEEDYRETWIFKKLSPDQWRPIRIHYSSITQKKHSEEVK